MLARKELSRFRRAAAVLPLAEALQKPAQMASTLNIPVERRADLKDREAALLRYAEALRFLKRRHVLPIAMEGRVGDICNVFTAMVPGTFDSGKDEDTLKRIKGILKHGAAHHSRLTENVDCLGSLISKVIVPTLLASTGYNPGAVGYSGREMQKDLQRDTKNAADILISGMMMRDVERTLTFDQMTDIIDLAEAGIDRVRRYAKIRHTMDNERTPSRKLKGQKALFALVCPEALAAIREQSETTPVRHDAPAEIPKEEIAPSPDERTVRSGSEDIGMLKRDYPALYKKMMKPTAKELEIRTIRNTAKRLMRNGASHEEVRRHIHGKPAAEEPASTKAADAHSLPKEFRLKRRLKQGPAENAGDAAPNCQPVAKQPRQRHPLDDVKRWGLTPNEFHRLLNQYGFDLSEVGGGGHCFVKYNGEKIRHADGRFVLVPHKRGGTEIPPGTADKVLKACADFLVLGAGKTGPNGSRNGADGTKNGG